MFVGDDEMFDEPNEYWIFRGYPGHFIDSANCRFHLTTYVNRGSWMVSTVGDYRPEYGEQKIMHPLSGNDQSYFETMVFPTRLDESSAFPSVLSWTEEYSDWYTNEKDALNGHLSVCRRYQRIERRFPTDEPGI